MMRASSLWLLAGVVTLAAAQGCGGGGSEGHAGGGSGAVQLDARRIFGGSLSAKGRITLPPGSGSGKKIQLTASGGGKDIMQRGSMVGPAGTTPGESFEYVVTGLVEGEYTFRARVDQDGDGNLSSPSDLDGHSGGTVEAPVFDELAARKVKVGPGSVEGVDFGLGVLK